MLRHSRRTFISLGSRSLINKAREVAPLSVPYYLILKRALSRSENDGQVLEKVQTPCPSTVMCVIERGFPRIGIVSGVSTDRKDTC